MKKKKLKQGSVSPATYFILTLTVVICVFPFVWVFLAATHTSTQIFQSVWTFRIGTNLLENYRNLMGTTNIWRNLFNSIFVAGAYTLLVCVIDSMAGYAFAKFQFKGKNLLFFICLCSMFIPQQVIVVPLFVEMTSFHMMNSLGAVIFPMLASVFGVFLMRQQMSAFPSDLLEAARIDGAGEVKIFAQVVIPTMKPAFASLGILSFVQRWGDYMWPLIVLQTKDKQTMPLILALMTTPGNPIDYGAAICGAVMTMLPVLILFLCFQKNFIDGMLSGAVKG